MATKEGLPQLVENLDKVKVQDLLDSKAHKGLIYLYSNDSLAKAIEVLSTHEIQSAPVKDVVGKYWLGFLDVMDITTYILKVCLAL